MYENDYCGWSQLNKSFYLYKISLWIHIVFLQTSPCVQTFNVVIRYVDNSMRKLFRFKPIVKIPYYSRCSNENSTCHPKNRVTLSRRRALVPDWPACGRGPPSAPSGPAHTIQSRGKPAPAPAICSLWQWAAGLENWLHGNWPDPWQP